MSKVFKSVAKIALPVIGTAIAGPIGGALGGAASGALGGGGLKGALLGAAMGGIGGGALGGVPSSTGIGFLDSINSGLYNFASPLRELSSMVGSGLSNLGSSLGGGLSSLFGSSAGSSASQLPWLTESGASKIFSSSPLEFLGNKVTSAGKLPWLTEAGTSKIFDSAAGQAGILEKIKQSLANPSLGDLASIAGIANALQESPDYGLRTQQDILNQMNADRAKQEAQNAKFLESLNAPPLQRERTSAPIDYYHYGSRPESLFFENVGGDNIQKFKKGGAVSPLRAAGGQEDDVPAMLSEGEYVIPADIVSSLGDGNTNAGAKQLTHLVKNIRKHKASAMKKGSLPPRAKSPLAYIGKHA